MTAKVEVKGVDDTARDLERWADKLGPDVIKSTQSLGDRIAASARGKVPHLTGTLAGSIEVIDVNDGWGVAMGEDVPYAGWIEFGGSRGRPLVPEGRYLQPTALDAENEYQSMASEVADDSISRFHWSKPSGGD